MIIAKICKLTPKYFNLSTGDTYIYEQHIVAVKHQLERLVLPEINSLQINIW